MAASDADNQPVRRNRFIYETLRDNIASGSLPPGLVLTESALARLFDVSRAPAADALGMLARDGLVARHDGRGFLVGDGGDTPVRSDLSASDIAMPKDSHDILAARSTRETLYPQVEVEIAGATGYGTFHITSAALASHYGVSRTTSQELLTRLERVGLVRQASNGRWIAPRLTAAAVRDHYEMRVILEPVALRQAAPDDRTVTRALARIARLRRAGEPRDVRAINEVEQDLHVDIVLACPNLQMRDTIRRSQLPLIATHAGFDRYRRWPEMARVLDDHEAVLGALNEGRREEAAQAMQDHLRHGEATTLNYLVSEPAPPEGVIPPYLRRADDAT